MLMGICFARWHTSVVILISRSILAKLAACLWVFPEVQYLAASKQHRHVFDRPSRWPSKDPAAALDITKPPPVQVVALVVGARKLLGEGTFRLRIRDYTEEAPTNTLK